MNLFNHLFEKYRLPLPVTFFLTICWISGFSQERNVYLNRDIMNRYEKAMNAPGFQNHTSIKPYRISEVNRKINTDSADGGFIKIPKDNLFWRKVRKEHLIDVNGDNYFVGVDPLFNLQGNYDFKDKDFTNTNTRGFQVLADLGKKKQLSLYSSFYENQSSFPSYLDSFVRDSRVVPGQGSPKSFYSGFDYAFASGYVSYSPVNYLNFQFGQDKHFIGDGYRSLFLSDNATNYPFFKITAEFWRIKYMSMYAQFLDYRVPKDKDFGYNKKNTTVHYLSLNVTKKLNLGLFESVIWANRDSSGYRGFDVAYLNPVIFLRPVEAGLGSPDNALIGFSLNYKIHENVVFYSQLLLDEFKLSEIRKGTGWWANKQSAQVGIKWFDIAGVKNLMFQTEFNYIRPYTYSHWSSGQSWEHMNQPMAHPRGANGWEWLGIANYRFNAWTFEGKIIYSEFGTDTANLNFGGSIWKSYNDRVSDYGNTTGQGLANKLIYLEGRVGYLINPASNMIVEGGGTVRNQQYGNKEKSNIYLFLSLRTNLFNKYYDF